MGCDIVSKKQSAFNGTARAFNLKGSGGQRLCELLEAEGILFDERRRLHSKEVGWDGIS
jgi:hypothetical protein